MSALKIVGSVVSDHDSSVCLLVDGRVVCCVNEERLARVRRGDKRNSIRRALHACLDQAGLTLDQVDWIFCDTATYYPPDHDPVDVFPDFERKDRVVQLAHHLGHISSAFFPSGFSDAAVLSVDASGGIPPLVPDRCHWGLLPHEVEFRDRGFTVSHCNPTLAQLLEQDRGGEARNYPSESLSACTARRGEKIVELFEHGPNASMGYFYALVAHFLGMEEGSFMGLSSHGSDSPFYETMQRIIRLEPEGVVRIDEDWMCWWQGDRVLDDPVNLKRLGRRFFEAFGDPKAPSDAIEQRHKDLAWATQRRLEDVLVHVAADLQRRSGLENICVAGGVGLNSVANQIIVDRTPFKRIFIQPGAADDGIALGNALFGHYVLCGLPRTGSFSMGSAALGPRYEQRQVLDLLANYDQRRWPVRYYPSIPFCREVICHYSLDGNPEQSLTLDPPQGAGPFSGALELHAARAVEYRFEVIGDPLLYLIKTEPATDEAASEDQPQQSELHGGKADQYHKFLRDNLDLAGVFNGEQAYVGPSIVTIDPTNRCNNNCIGCWTRSPLLGDEMQSAQWMNLELPGKLIRELIDQLHELRTKQVRFTGGGEPFMHPELLELMAHVKDRGMGCAVTTNFSVMKPEWVSRMAALELDEVTVSLWAGTPEVYGRSHPSKTARTFERIEAHLRQLCAEKTERTKVLLANVLFSMNFMETREMLDFALRVGADGIYFTLVDSVSHKTDGLLLTPPHVEVLTEHLEQVRQRVAQLPPERSFVLDNYEGLMRRLGQGDVQNGRYDLRTVDQVPCAVGWIFSRVLADGDVAPCCRGSDKPMGNLFKESFKQIWNGERYREFRRMALNKRKSDPYFREIDCYRTCDNLMHNEQLQRRMEALSETEHKYLERDYHEVVDEK
ncbi:MAG: carbamoyltransferase N-terminal domain-containing protein [Candidatus Alcyoniella australis]|nr:carbamoyltransferase N-terminal domain-containing protein [Candidatus Alcyoniella australis]